MYNRHIKAVPLILSFERYFTVPGPRPYNFRETINKKGKYLVSKYHDSGATMKGFELEKVKRKSFFQIFKIA